MRWQGFAGVGIGVLASACVTATPVMGPGGEEHQLIKCNSSEDCYEKAEEVCNGPYQLVDSGNRSNAGTWNTTFAESWHEMLVKCGGESPSTKTSHAVVVAAAPKPATDAPTAAAGFTFGDSVDAAKAACANASLEWSQERKGYRCSGTPVDTGMPAHARLTFCEDELCRIDVIVAPEGEKAALADDIQRIVTTLSKRYGEPNERDVLYGQSCVGAALPECVAKGASHFWYEWRWAGGHKISLSLGSRKPVVPVEGTPPPKPIAASIRIHYDDGRAVKTVRAAGTAASDAPRPAKGDVEGL